jgi:hypothetical protein
VEYKSRPRTCDGIYLILSPVLLNDGDAAFSSLTRHQLKYASATSYTFPKPIMRSPPPEVLKTWPKPNYVDPVTRGSTLMIVELTLLPIAIIVVCLRMWVRVGWLKKAWWDDYLMLLAMVTYPPCASE